MGFLKQRYSVLWTRSIACLIKLILEILLRGTFAAAYVSELVGTNKLPKTQKEPWWKRWLEGMFKEFNQDLDFVNILLEKRNGCLDSRVVLVFLTKGPTVVIQKDKVKGDFCMQLSTYYILTLSMEVINTYIGRWDLWLFRKENVIARATERVYTTV